MGSLKYLNKYLLKHKYRLLLGFLFIICSNIFAVIPAQFIRDALDIVKAKLNNQVYVKFKK